MDASGQDNTESPRDVTSTIARIYDAFYRRIYAYCASRLFVRDLAEDATSQVFMHFVEQYGQLRRKDAGTICRWLHTTARNVVARRLRSRKRRKEILAEAARQAAARSSANTDPGQELDWPVLYLAMSRLPRRYQEVLHFRYVEGMEISGIADVMGMKPTAVRVTLFRAIRKLRARLEKSLGD